MKSRLPTPLPQSLDKSLKQYVLAASAGFLALSHSAAAKIVYTPAHVYITPNHILSLDLNNDGISDFTFKDVLSTTSVGEFRADRLSIFPVGSNQIWGHKLPTGSRYASALPPGVVVGASGAFSAGTRSLAAGFDDVGSVYCEGKWWGARNRYLGLKFSTSGKTHFGWARLSVACRGYKVGALLTGYAYETIANQSIVTGKTKADDETSTGISMPAAATLGSLARGVSIP